MSVMSQLPPPWTCSGTCTKSSDSTFKGKDTALEKQLRGNCISWHIQLMCLCLGEMLRSIGDCPLSHACT